MKKRIILSLLSLATISFIACGGDSNANKGFDNSATGGAPAPEAAGTAATPTVGEYDPHRGEGKWNEENVKIAGLDKAMASKGESISETKCMSCHKVTDERLVGPGWKGVTTRHTPAWIMNFITNPDAMIDKDPELQSQLELCLVRMPDQSLADNEAREILEFMRKNDGAK